MSTFLMLASSALSTAFWSAARELLICFFCSSARRVRVPSPFLFAETAGAPRDPRGESGGRQAHLWLLALLEESLLASLVLGLLAGEVLGLRDLVDLLRVDALQVHLLRRRNDISRVDSPERHAVDLEGAGNEQDALVEGLEEDDALAPEAAGQQDQDRAGLKRLPRLPRADGLASLAVACLVSTSACLLPSALANPRSPGSAIPASGGRAQVCQPGTKPPTRAPPQHPQNLPAAIAARCRAPRCSRGPDCAPGIFAMHNGLTSFFSGMSSAGYHFWALAEW